MKKLVFIIASVMLITGCVNTSEEANIRTSSSGAVSFEGYAAENAPNSRTEITNEAGKLSFKWVKDTDIIGMFASDADGEIAANTAYSAQASGAKVGFNSVSEDETLYWGTGAHDFYAYYPYSEDAGDDVQSIPVSVPGQQTQTDATPGHLASLDFAYSASKGVSEDGSAVGLSFSHIFSVLNIQLASPDEEIGVSEVIFRCTDESEVVAYDKAAVDLTADNVAITVAADAAKSHEITLAFDPAITVGASITNAYMLISPGHAGKTFEIVAVVGTEERVLATKTVPAEGIPAGKKVIAEASTVKQDGSEEFPYILKTKADLINMRNLFVAKQYVWFELRADIDMDGVDWKPLNTTDPYDNHMHFDGKGHVIKNLTSKGHSYAGFVGVLCGSVRNLGLLDAVVESPNGAGIIGGYVGLQTPVSAAKTGIVENCFTSGSVTGNNGVGGIAGNIGKQKDGSYSMIQNSYSTATVTATNTSGNARVGGIAGVVWSGACINYCYSTGTITSDFHGAGGIAGYSDANTVGCVALNAELSNASSGNLGRISAVMGGTPPAQGVGCYALAGMILDNGGTPKTDLVTGEVTSGKPQYDGVTKAAVELSNIATYTSIGWKTSGADQVWASQTNGKGYPILKWQYDRSDYDTMDGHADSPALADPVKQDGTEEFPYILKTKTDLLGMSTLFVPGEYVWFELGADIDMDGVDWKPLNMADPYNNHMHFDGKGHIIKNLASKGYPYAGFAGVVCGSVRNLGILNADVVATGGTGIIGGYVGLRDPANATKTGIIENCFTSGTVSGTNAVGGIAGNVGKKKDAGYSAIINCYSTATVTATTTSGDSRAGGIAGIVYSGATVENCYSAGAVVSKRFGAGGIMAYSDINVVGCVALNPSITNTVDGKMGRIAAFMGGTPNVMQGENCLALDGMTLDNGGTPKTDLITGTVTNFQGPYDGATKTAAELKDIATYTEIGWKTSGAGQVWAGQLNAKGYPILQWQFARGDYDTMSGH